MIVMSVLSLRWKLTVVGVIAYVAVAWYFGGDAGWQRQAVADEKEKPGPGKKEGPTPMYYGVAHCANPGCHGGSKPKVWLPGKEIICRCIEAIDWDKKDKHADAYNVLTRARGQQMAKILGYDVTKSDACLACHGVVIKDEKLLKESKENLFKIEEGVNCVACHGAYDDWIAQHAILGKARTWRPLSRDEKEAKGGMRNLWDPVKRAELCVSCHIGNLKEGKFVTHAMYAAGHPPLPGFEAATFSEQMPRHWQYLREKSPALQKELGYKPGEEEQTKLILIGAAVALRQTMALLEEQAKEAQAAKDDDGKALDLSNFDCYACHHDLKAPSWRQTRGYPGKPGRVPMRPWSTELIRLAIEASGDPAEQKKSLAAFNTALAKVHKGFDARPFGDPKKIEAAARGLKEWAGTLADSLDKATINKAMARKLLASIPGTYRGTKEHPLTLDYDSARQVAWAFKTIYGEVNGKTSNPKIDTAIKSLEDNLKLFLPKGRDKVVEDELKESLEKINDYDPKKFRKLLGELAAGLEK
jgi:mono/diheme cytochrome c family protein